MDIRLKEFLHNLKDRNWDVNPVYKIDENEARRVIEGIEGINKWIPCNVRLPKTNENVLVCYESGHIETAYYYIDTNCYPSEYEDCCETGWYNYNEDLIYEQDVVAWMPLPQAYKAESEDKE